MIDLYGYDNASYEECIDDLYETMENLNNNYMDFEALERYGIRLQNIAERLQELGEEK